MKKQNQAPRKKAKTSRKTSQQKPPRLRQFPVFTMDQLERSIIIPATAKIERGRHLSKQEIARLRVIPLSAGQARKLGPGFPTLESFLPLATDLQLVQLLGAVPMQWSRKELGPRRGEVTLMAIVNPPKEEVPPRVAGRLRALVSKEIASRPHLSKRMEEVRFIETHAAPALLRRFRRKIDALARTVIQSKKRAT